MLYAKKPGWGARKGSLRHLESGCPVTRLSLQNSAPSFKAHFWSSLGGTSPYKSGGYWLPKMPERPLSALEDWLPDHAVWHPDFCALFSGALLAYFSGLPAYQSGGYWWAKAPEKATFGTRVQSAQVPCSAPRFLRLSLGRTPGLLLWTNSLTNIGATACKRCQGSVPEMAAFGTQRQAAQPHGPAPSATYVMRTPEV